MVFPPDEVNAAGMPAITVLARLETFALQVVFMQGYVFAV
jgi:hypothetical protein